MPVILSLPRFLDGIRAVRSPTDEEGRFTMTYPCGCVAHCRRSEDGGVYGDIRTEICGSHVRECSACGEQTWPHRDCRCEEAP